jgi:hypothetical protein
VLGRAISVVCAIAAALVAGGCGSGAPATRWVASEVYVVDDRASCMEVTAADDGRRVSVCRDGGGSVSCRLAADAGTEVSRPDCSAAIRAVRDWEAGETPPPA